MGLSVWQLLIIAAVILILFGRGKISEVMGDFGKGVSSFKKGMSEEDAKPNDAAQLKGPDAAPSADSAKDSQKNDSSGN